MFFKKQEMISADKALPGRDTPISVASGHFVHGRPLTPPFEGMESIVVGMGCFWGAERKFWTLTGVHTTAVGYSAGHTPHPTYRGGRLVHWTQWHLRQKKPKSPKT